jgi:hypothetical protein
MSTPLRQRLSELASSFASNVLSAIRGASLEDLVGQRSDGRRAAARAAAPDGPARAAKRRGGRLPRRSAKDIEQVVEQIVTLLRQSPKGLRAEQIREKLNLQAKELPRPLKEALDSGRLGKSGQKRATTYYLKGGASGSKPAARAASAGRRARRAGRKGRAKPAKRGRPVEKKAVPSASEAPSAES